MGVLQICNRLRGVLGIVLILKIIFDVEEKRICLEPSVFDFSMQICLERIELSERGEVQSVVFEELGIADVMNAAEVRLRASFAVHLDRKMDQSFGKPLV